MEYYNKITALTAGVPNSLVDFSSERIKARVPSQASSEFITNKEQGDWAETLILKAFNETSTKYIAVKYGKSDNVVAGEDGFETFYKDFQIELDTIGKRPDVLIFKKEDFDGDLGNDISSLPHSTITQYVKKAIAGIEIRSSAFLIDKYEAWMQIRTEKFTKTALLIKEDILNNYQDLLSHPGKSLYIDLLNNLKGDTLSISSFRCPSWSSSERLVALSGLFKQLKNAIKEIQKRDFLSITPKVEDIKVVYKWIETFNVPHFYFQVFFDKVYGIAFENILKIISNPDNEGLVFNVERDSKNQNKSTIKIKSKSGHQIGYKIDEPQHQSIRKEIGRGRLLFYVTFNGGTAYLDINNLKTLLGITEDEF
jgi:hypothetical protein